MGLKSWIAKQLGDGLKSKEGREVAKELLADESTRGVVREILKSKMAREAAEELLKSEAARDVAKEVAKDMLDNLGGKVRAGAQGIADQLTAPFREAQERRVADQADRERLDTARRADRERRQAAERTERELDDELAALKKRIEG